MQRTRLNILFDQTTLRFRQWAFNPWRRLAVVLISLLFGTLFANGVSATAGQTAQLDVVIAAILVAFTELISWLYYRFTPRRRKNDRLPSTSPSTAIETNGVLLQPDSISPLTGLEAGPVRSRSTLIESLNAFKIGMVYGLFLEAFKLGS